MVAATPQLSRTSCLASRKTAARMVTVCVCSLRQSRAENYALTIAYLRRPLCRASVPPAALGCLYPSSPRARARSSPRCARAAAPCEHAMGYAHMMCTYHDICISSVPLAFGRELMVPTPAFARWPFAQSAVPQELARGLEAMLPLCEAALSSSHRPAVDSPGSRGDANSCSFEAFLPVGAFRARAVAEFITQHQPCSTLTLLSFVQHSRARTTSTLRRR
eukprot:SAG11_NODE_1184_length_5591_cov_3.538420_2_plen_220_part_00